MQFERFQLARGYRTLLNLFFNGSKRATHCIVMGIANILKGHIEAGGGGGQRVLFYCAIYSRSLR